MITKTKTTQFTTSDGTPCLTIEYAKAAELSILVGKENTANTTAVFDALVAKSREAIAILKLGLPRKPRTAKAKVVKAKKASATPAA